MLNLAPAELTVFQALLVGALGFAVGAALARYRLRRLFSRFHRLRRRVVGSGDADIHGAIESLQQELLEQGLALTHAEQELQQQEQILGALTEGVVYFDAGRVRFCNRAALSLLGWENVGDCLGRTLEEVVRNASLQRLIARGNRELPLEEQEIELDFPEQGRSLWVLATVSWLTGTEKAVLTLTDVTKVRRLEAMRREFVANVSHELKTPIATIQGAVETMLSGAGQTPADTERFLRIVERHSQRLSAIFDDMLTLSRLEYGDSLTLEPTKISEVVRAAVGTVEDRATQRGLTIQFECDPATDGVVTEAYPPFLELALTNLLENAVKFSERGPITVFLKRISRNEADWLQISVQDRGVGIEPLHLDRIFERFYRVDRGRSRQVGGTGLGLSIVKHIVQAHRGEITVESRPGEGSTFVIALPLPVVTA